MDVFLIFHVTPAALTVRPDQVIVGKGCLRIFVQVFHVRVGRGALEVKVILLDVFTVIAFVVGEAKEAFLDDRVAAIPERNGKAEQLFVVADSCQTVFTPVIGAGSGLIVGEIRPSIAVWL